jgi:hypothetical protein
MSEIRTSTQRTFKTHAKQGFEIIIKFVKNDRFLNGSPKAAIGADAANSHFIRHSRPLCKAQRTAAKSPMCRMMRLSSKAAFLSKCNLRVHRLRGASDLYLFKYSTLQVLVREMIAGSSINSIATIEGLQLAPGNVVRLEVSASIAILQVDTGSGLTTIGTLTGITIDGGFPAIGAYPNNAHNIRSVSLRSIQVENL